MNLTKGRVELTGVRRMMTVAACGLLAVATGASALALRMEIAGPSMGTAAANGNETKAKLKIPAGVMAGNILVKTMPVYPVEAKANKDVIDGAVELAVVIGKDGTIEQIHVSKSLRADYDKSALDAVKDWRYKPYLLNGEPTEVESTVTVNYSTTK